MNKRKFFLLPICLLLLGACSLNQHESKESKEASEPEVSSVVEECEHEFGDWTVSMIPTCTEAGEETRVCSKCGASEKRVVPALEHQWDEGRVTVVPTVDAKGTKVYTCERCGETRSEDIEKAKGINVTFTQGEHFEVWVYRTKAYTTEQPTKTNTCLARDENGNAIDFDANGALFPQVSFKVVCEEGYSVGVNNIEITGGTYKNLKQGPTVGDDGSADLPDNNHFRITKIQSDITVKITPINGEQKLPETKFVTNNCSVVVYKSQTISDENIVAEGPFYARDKSTGNEVQTGGQIYFKVVPEAGYVWGDAPTADVDDLNTLPFIARNSSKSGNKFKIVDAANGVYNITKVEDDLSILINCIPEGGEDGLGHVVTFVTNEHCHVLVYQTKDYEFTPTAPVEGKVLSRTEDGSAAKYVADNPDTADVDEEIKPQVNFLVVCDEGYEFVSGVTFDSKGEAKASNVPFISGNFNKLKNIGNNIYRITKISGDLTVTINATAVAA